LIGVGAHDCRLARDEFDRGESFEFNDATKQRRDFDKL
jgi:hypothetical protein